MYVKVDIPTCLWQVYACGKFIPMASSCPLQVRACGKFVPVASSCLWQVRAESYPSLQSGGFPDVTK